MIAKFFKDESGATAIEYGILTALMALVVIGATASLDGILDTVFGKITTALAD